MWSIFLIVGIISLIISIIVLVKFFQVCKDVRTISNELSEIKAINATKLDESNRYVYMKKRIFEIILPEDSYLSHNPDEDLTKRIDRVVDNDYKVQINNVIKMFGFTGSYSTEELKKELFEKYKVEY